MIGWKDAWNVIWWNLVTQALQRSQADEPLPQSGIDRWSSTWQSFPFRIQMRTLAWAEPTLFPSIKGTDPHLASWSILRRRLITAHQKPDTTLVYSSSDAQAFLSLLGLDGSLQTKRSSKSRKPLPDQKALQRETSREIRPEEHSLSQKTIRQISLWGNSENL